MGKLIGKSYIEFMRKDNLFHIANKYGTPSYVFDTEMLLNRVRAIRSIVEKNIRLCFSMKANPFLLQYIYSVVDNVEVCSPGELDICISLSSMGHIGKDFAKKIVYSGVVKTRDDISEALDACVGIISAESLYQVDIINQEAKKHDITQKVLLRLNSKSQFGMSEKELCKVIKERDIYGNIIIAGIHYFAGTQRKYPDLQLEELEMLDRLIQNVREQYGLNLLKLEYGPGLPVPLFEGDDFSDDLMPLKTISKKLNDLSQKYEVTIEMGRFITANCGCYLTKVVENRFVREHNYCLVDGGIHHLTYSGQIMGMKVPVIHVLSGKTREKKKWSICGSLCTTNDKLVREVEMETVEEGGIICFMNTGAYSVTESMYLFLSRDMPNIVAWDGRKGTLLRNSIQTYKINMMKGNDKDEYQE